MKPEHWVQVEQLYHAALEQDDAERRAFLENACGGNDALRREVESLLSHDKQAEDFIESPAIEAVALAIARNQPGSLLEPGLDMTGRTISHYRILEKLGGGGMGVVYKARDIRLGRLVALKFLPEGFSQDPTAISRFRREARAASSLNHPNICTIYDIGESEGHAFIAMEYLDGYTLKHLIDEQSLGNARLIRLAVQIAAALESAHTQHIIHRDIKPANIFVTQRGEAKILDFGLAKLAPVGAKNTTFGAPSSPAKSTELELTSPGVAIGTVAYMSPEQARGEDLDVRTDLFSFGAVLYEMAGRKRAFDGTATALVFDGILNRNPVALPTLNPDLPKEFVNVIDKAMVKDRDARYQSAAEMLADLKAIAENPRAHFRNVTRQTRSVPNSFTQILPWSVAAALVLALITSLGFYVRSQYKRRQSTIGNLEIPARRSVAVLGLKNLSGKSDDDWLSTAVSEMLTTELAAGEKLRTISGEDVARTRASLALPNTDSLGRDTLRRVHKSLGTDFVVIGSYLDMGGQVRLDLRLQDANMGETIATVSDEGSQAHLLDLVSRSGQQLREKLGVQAITPSDAVSVKASMPSNPDAARLYSQGLDRLRTDDVLAARDLLEESVAAEPAYPLSHEALAAAWDELGYDHKAKSEASKAYQLSSHLSREDQLAVEGRYHLVAGDYDKAVEVYRALFTLLPDNLNYGLNLAKAQADAGKAGDALSTLDSVRKLPPPLSEDPRIDLQAATAYRSDHAKALAADEEAVKKGQAFGAKWIVARARGSACAHLTEMGQLDAAFTACQDARQIYATTGDRNGEAKELNDLAYISIQQGKLAESKELFKQALAQFRSIGNDAATAATLANLGITVYGEGDLAGAYRMLRAALPKYQKVEDFEGESLLLTNLGELLTDEGELHHAEQNYRQALAIAERTNDKRSLAYALAGLGDPLLCEGNLVEARKSYERSWSLREEIGEKAAAAESQTYLAELTIEEGQPAVAENLARQALKEFQNDQQSDDELTASAVLIKALLAENKITEARAIVDAESALAAKNQNHIIGPSFVIAAARTRAASGDINQARANLEAVLKAVHKERFVGYAYEARLALAEIEIRSGRRAAGLSELALLKADANAKGYGLIAHKAATKQ